MALAASLTAHLAPLVILDGTALAPGQEFVLSGSAGGRSWVVAAGTVAATSMTWADPLAPLGTESTYSLRVGAATSTATVTRPGRPGGLLLCRPDGRGQVLADRDLDIADPRSRDLRSYGETVIGRASEASSWGAAAGLPSGELDVVVAVADLDQAEATLHRRGSVLLLGGAPRPGMAPVRRVRVVSVDDELWAPWGDRRYRVRFQSLALPAASGAPLATWGEARALGWTWGTGLTWRQVTRAVAAGLTPAQAGV
jgi:hypothetical protein